MTVMESKGPQRTHLRRPVINTGINHPTTFTLTTDRPAQTYEWSGVNDQNFLRCGQMLNFLSEKRDHPNAKNISIQETIEKCLLVNPAKEIGIEPKWPPSWETTSGTACGAATRIHKLVLGERRSVIDESEVVETAQEEGQAPGKEESNLESCTGQGKLISFQNTQGLPRQPDVHNVFKSEYTLDQQQKFLKWDKEERKHQKEQGQALG